VEGDGAAPAPRGHEALQPAQQGARGHLVEHDGIIRRKVFPEIPPKVEYSLTTLGRSLEPVLRAMHAWGEAFEHRLPSATAS
jgi:hypothetical protein